MREMRVLEQSDVAVKPDKVHFLGGAHQIEASEAEVDHLEQWVADDGNSKYDCGKQQDETQPKPSISTQRL